MSTGSISDALSRITAIEQQLQQLSSGSLLDSQSGVGTAGAASSSTGSTQTADTGSTDFANALAQAQSYETTSSTDATTAATASQMTGGVAPSSGATLTTSAGTALTAGQQQFAATLSADTGLNPSVVTAWLLSEESGSAAKARQAAGDNDWLNVGRTDSGTYGAGDSVWADPVTAATATAQWLQGQSSVAGYGTASAGVQSILASVGQTPAAQIQAIQSSGWSSGGYPSLNTLYSQVVGS